MEVILKFLSPTIGATFTPNDFEVRTFFDAAATYENDFDTVFNPPAIAGPHRYPLNV